ncbi:MAG TPA: BON domain-containing protein [Gammaproteobacteria bacterium]|nr:BON domain-containing protein [Gammaproteobacteria bacterium]
MNNIKRNAVLGTAVLLLSGAAYADSFEGASKDAWLTGKVETVFLLNRHLNNFEINTDVEDGIVHLTGTVESDVESDLAFQLAKGVDGVVEVRNDLVVDADFEPSERESVAEGDSRSFGAWVDDATTTAAVKAKLIGNGNIEGLKIDVDTRSDVVTLSGRVDTDEQKSLAEEIALNTGDVGDVRNNLVVDAQ